MDTATEAPSMDEAALHYRTYRNAFIGWSRKHLGADPEDAKDAFQEAVCTYYELKRVGRLDGFTGEVRTYLFAIGRNQLLSRMRAKRIAGNHSAPYAIHLQSSSDKDVHQQLEREETRQQVQSKLEQLEPTDRRVLELYYIDRLDMREIAETMGYKNANVAKKKKCIALKRLVDDLAHTLELNR